MRVLKIEVKRLRHEETGLLKNCQNMEEMKKEMLNLQKDLLAEKTKVKSLQAELESPLNVHRWRKLEGKGNSKINLRLHRLYSKDNIFCSKIRQPWN